MLMGHGGPSIPFQVADAVGLFGCCERRVTGIESVIRKQTATMPARERSCVEGIGGLLKNRDGNKSDSRRFRRHRIRPAAELPFPCRGARKVTTSGRDS